LCCNELNRDGEDGFLIHEQNYSELAAPVPVRTAVANKQASDERRTSCGGRQHSEDTANDDEQKGDFDFDPARIVVDLVLDRAAMRPRKPALSSQTNTNKSGHTLLRAPADYINTNIGCV